MTPPPNRRNPRQERARATVEAVLEAAAQVLEAKGLKGATTNAIAERAGVSVGSLYQYFPDKGSLVLALYERHVTQLEKAMAARFQEAEGRPLTEAVSHLIQGLVAHYQARPALQRVLVEEVPHLHGEARTRAAEASIRGCVQGFLEARRAELDHPRPDLAASVIVATVEALTHAAAREGRLLEAELLPELDRLVLAYLKPGCLGGLSPSS